MKVLTDSLEGMSLSCRVHPEKEFISPESASFERRFQRRSEAGAGAQPTPRGRGVLDSPGLWDPKSRSNLCFLTIISKMPTFPLMDYLRYVVSSVICFVFFYGSIV